MEMTMQLEIRMLKELTVGDPLKGVFLGLQVQNVRVRRLCMEGDYLLDRARVPPARKVKNRKEGEALGNGGTSDGEM